jgi:ketosteroid isomerase-like protein
MKSLVAGLALLAVVGCAAPSGDWDAQATASLKAEVDWMLKALDRGDIAGMVDRMDPDAVVFDTDENNQPVRAVGIEQVKKYMLPIGDSMKAQNLKFASVLRTNECHATRTMGFCAIEFDQTMTQGDKTMGPFKFRGTLVARRVGDAWRWVHWHGSLAEVPK